MDLRQEMEAIFWQACQAHPQLPWFRSTKKGLLWGMMALFALLRTLEGFLYWQAGHSALAMLRVPLGLVLPGIFALSVWRGHWKFSFLLLIPAGSLALGLLSEIRAALLLGFDTLPLPVLIYLAANAAAILYLAGVLLWLLLPRNRELSIALNQVTGEQIRRSKELTPPPRPM